jgi:hypothetical protein
MSYWPSRREATTRDAAVKYFGQILFVLEPGNVFLKRPMGFYRLMHGSPWDYDRHIPLVFYGPGFVTAGIHNERVHQQDIAATVLPLSGVSPVATMSGKNLDFIVRNHEAPPRVTVVVVLDGMRADYLERYGDVMPTLSRMRREGADFHNAFVNYVPTVTSSGHVTISTGADPRVHGISSNGYYDRVGGRAHTLFDRLSPKNVMTLGIADLWNYHFSKEAVVIAQGTTPRATVGLSGHGACIPNGRATILTMFDYDDERWKTNPDCFVLPEYVSSASARETWEQAGGRWRNLDIDNGRVFVMTPLFPEFQMDALMSMIEHEGVGRDNIPDLLMVSFKSTDYAGHNFGPDAGATAEVLAAVDDALGRALNALDAAAGPDGYVVAVTADHGMPTEPNGAGQERRFVREMLSSLQDQLDPGENRLFFEFLETSSHQLYVDETRMRQLGISLDDIARVVEALPYVRMAFTETEMRAGSLRGR